MILLELRAFVMKYQANKRRMEKEKTDLLKAKFTSYRIHKKKKTLNELTTSRKNSKRLKTRKI